MSTLLSESAWGEPPMDMNAAARHALAAVSLRPGAATWCRYGRLLRLTGDQEGAREALESALRLDPDHPGSLYELGQVYHDTNRPAEAVGHFERLVAFDEAIAAGPQASFHSALGIAARRAGAAVRSSPHNPPRNPPPEPPETGRRRTPATTYKRCAPADARQGSALLCRPIDDAMRRIISKGRRVLAAAERE